MLRNALSSAVVFAFVFTVNASSAFAAPPSATPTGTDPVQIADNAQGVFEPIAKVVWWIMLVGSLLFLRSSRRSSNAVGALGGLALAGIFLYNPAGAGAFMQGLANSIF